MKAKKRLFNGNSILLLITVLLFAGMYAAGCIIYADKGFTHVQTFLNVLITKAALIVVACGMTCVMLTGGIDISVGSLIYYMRSRNFEVFRFIQLTLFLFAPFIMQWSIGSSITSSRSRSAGGIVSRMLAVVMNITCDRS